MDSDRRDTTKTANTAQTLPDGGRLIRCLLGEPVDRVPFGVGIGWHPWGSALWRWRKESGIANLDIRAQFRADEEFLLLPSKYGIFPHFDEKVLAENDTTVTRRTKYGVVKRDVRRGHSMVEEFMMPCYDRIVAFAREHGVRIVSVNKAAWMIANGGRYIPGFDHLIPSNVPRENMRYAAERIKAVCYGE